MAFWNRRSGRSIEPDSRGVYPTHAPLKTLDNRELMEMFKKDIGGAPSGALFGGYGGFGGSYMSAYRTGPSRMAKLQEAYGGTQDSATWVFACVSLIASTGAAYPWRLTGDDGQTVEAPPADLVKLLERPNREWTYFDLVETILTDLELVGNCYVLRNELNKLGQPGSLQRLRPERTMIALNPDGTVRGYVYTVANGIRIPYDTWEVMHFKYPSPLDTHYGMGTVEAIAPLIDRHIAQTGHITGFFQNGARISGVLTVPTTMTDTAFERLKQTYQEQFAGSAAAYKMLIAEGAVDYKPITQGPAAAGVVDLLKASKDEILSAFGVPEFLMGGAHQAGVEKMEEAQNIFLRAMIPRARRVAERVTNDIAQMWGLHFRIDPHANEPLSVRIAYAKEMMGAGATVNEAREAMNLPLIDDDELADKILVPNNLIPLDLAGQPPRPATSMPMAATGEHGSANGPTMPGLPPAGGTGGNGTPSLEEQLAQLPALLANGGKDAEAVARLSATLRAHQRMLEAATGKAAGGGGDGGDDDEESDGAPERVVPPGPWVPIPALVHLIEQGQTEAEDDGKDYNPDEERDDHGRWVGGGGSSDDGGGGGAATAVEVEVTPITAEQAQGNSRAVSAEEFQALAAEGKAKLDAMAQSSSPITALNTNWDGIKSSAYEAAQQSWGGQTIDAHTGEALASNADKYALTVKPPGFTTVSVPETATAEQFAAAMDTAKANFGSELQQGNRYLGVFHDDSAGRIDIDPVVVVDTPAEVERIGAYTHAVGGAYHFKSGNGYWPPHVASAKRASAISTVEEALKAWGAKYSDDQPRDDHGRWTSGGGSAEADSNDGGGGPTWAEAIASVRAAQQEHPDPYGRISREAELASITTDHQATYYHSSASANRDSILNDGLEANRSLGGMETRIYLDSVRDDPEPRIDTGPRDYYQIDTSGLPLRPDPELPDRWAISEQNIPVDRLKLISTTGDPIKSKSQTVAREWTPPVLPRGFEPITKASSPAQQLMRDVQAECLRAGVDIFEPTFRKFFRAQRDRVITALSDYASTTRGARLRGRPTKTKANFQGVDDIFDSEAEDQALRDAYTPALQDATEQALEAVPKALETRKSVAAPVDHASLIEDLRTQLAGRVVRINETTRLAISDVVTEGLRRGYSIPQIANGYADENYPGVMGVFDQATDVRAETIARTESAFAFNGTQATLYRADGIGSVEIMDGTDWDEACAEADGQVWTLDEYEANPIEHPNCTRSAVPSDQGSDDGGG